MDIKQKIRDEIISARILAKTVDEATDEILLIVGITKPLKTNYPENFESWLLGFEKRGKKYIVDNEQINTKQEMYDLYREL